MASAAFTDSFLDLPLPVQLVSFPLLLLSQKSFDEGGRLH